MERDAKFAMTSYFSNIVKALAVELREETTPKILKLEGDLGVGKTTFVKELLCELGFDPNEVQSPTFLKVLEYDVPHFGLVVHMDCYRIDSAEELVNIGLEHYLDTARLLCVEWPALLSELSLASHANSELEFVFSMSAEGRRKIERRVVSEK